ncbi:MAG: rRNA maturation RNase YbeY [Candidatus Berkelbacteria bacterium]|nr:rRNA maturation RNase YbeY [Candidatus Berkelbacteria bacterium]
MSSNKAEVRTIKKFSDYSAVLKKEALDWLKKRGEKNCWLEIEIAGKSKVRSLNKKYLNRDYPTDVLSFPLKTVPGEKATNIGTVIICGDIIEEQAEKTNKSFEKEIIFVLRHGINHLLGIHHPE